MREGEQDGEFVEEAQTDEVLLAARLGEVLQHHGSDFHDGTDAELLEIFLGVVGDQLGSVLAGSYYFTQARSGLGLIRHLRRTWRKSTPRKIILILPARRK